MARENRLFLRAFLWSPLFLGVQAFPVFSTGFMKKSIIQGMHSMPFLGPKMSCWSAFLSPSFLVSSLLYKCPGLSAVLRRRNREACIDSILSRSKCNISTFPKRLLSTTAFYEKWNLFEMRAPSWKIEIALV